MRVRWSQGALEDLYDITAYLVMKNSAAAERVSENIFNAALGLNSFPFSGRLNKKFGSRELIVPKLPYVIDYDLHEDEVLILRVRHGARNFAN